MQLENALLFIDVNAVVYQSIELSSMHSQNASLSIVRIFSGIDIFLSFGLLKKQPVGIAVNALGSSIAVNAVFR